MSERAVTEVERVRDAVLAVEGVADLHAGPFGDIATYLPGRRVHGVRIHDADVEVHIIANLDNDIRQVARAARTAAMSALDKPLGCTVIVEDVAPIDDAGPHTEPNAQESSES